MYEIAGELYEMVTKDGASVQLISNNLEVLCRLSLATITL